MDNIRTITEPARQIKVCRKTDLCVVGGSCTGVFAAVRAARLGLKAVIVEMDNCLGGVAAGGLVNVWHKLLDESRQKQIIAGLTQEMLERLDRLGAVNRSDDPQRLAAYELNTEEMKIELDGLCAEQGIEVFFHTMYCAPVVEDGKLTGIIVENKDGRQAILADFFIDATGDGDIARDVGLKAFKYDHIQPPSPCYKMIGDSSGVNISGLIQEHGAEFGLKDDWGWDCGIPGLPLAMFRADTHVFGIDCERAQDLSLGETEGRRQVRAVMDILRKYSGRDFTLISLFSHLGIRDSVHYESDYRLSGEDLMAGSSYPDTVAQGTYPIDVHHSDNAGITYRYLGGYEYIHNDRTSPPEVNYWRDAEGSAKYYQIPFRCLVQRRIGNLIPVGRMINADASAYGAVRVMVNLNQLGEAAGVAAYLCLNGDSPVWDVDAGELRGQLIKGGSAL